MNEKDTASDFYLDALVPASLHHSIGAEVGTPLSLAVVCQNMRNRNQVLTCFTGTKVLAYGYKSTDTDTTRAQVNRIQRWAYFQVMLTCFTGTKVLAYGYKSTDTDTSRALSGDAQGTGEQDARLLVFLVRTHIQNRKSNRCLGSCGVSENI